tara:strand:- start:76 stop:276 length:201 start_codon:yes stop_codon:yes gene_type:complete
MSKSKKVTLKLEPTGAAALHGIIAAEQKLYTTDPKCTPARIVELRKIMDDIDNQLETILNNETPDA